MWERVILYLLLHFLIQIFFIQICLPAALHTQSQTDRFLTIALITVPGNFKGEIPKKVKFQNSLID